MPAGTGLPWPRRAGLAARSGVSTGGWSGWRGAPGCPGARTGGAGASGTAPHLRHRRAPQSCRCWEAGTRCWAQTEPPSHPRGSARGGGTAVRQLPTAPQLPTGALLPPCPTVRPPGGGGTHLLTLVLFVTEEPVRLRGEMGEGLRTGEEQWELGAAGEPRPPCLGCGSVPSSSHVDARPPTNATYMLDEGLHDFVAVWHVRHHVGHVVLGCPHQRGAKHQSQVSGLHLQPEPGSVPARGHPPAFAIPSGTVSLPTPPRAVAQPKLGGLKMGQGFGRARGGWTVPCSSPSGQRWSSGDPPGT